MCEAVLHSVVETFKLLAIVFGFAFVIFMGLIISADRRDRRESDDYEERAANAEKRRDAAKEWNRRGGKGRRW